MDTVNFQIPIKRDLKDAAAEVALNQGFSSLQEAVRIFINKMAKGSIDFIFEPKTAELNKKSIERYDKISEEIERGENIQQIEDVDDLVRQLNS